MEVKNNLEILIPTFNRKETLSQLLNQVLSNDSPIKDCDIKILDNSSTDGTSKMCEELSEKYQNITHIRHNRNIGLAGNICRAMEIASKKYFWILFDDTGIDWVNWQEIEHALNGDYNIVLTANYYLNSKTDLAQILLILIYLPAGIFKTENITDEVMTYAMTDIYTVHPQLALICSIMNNSGKGIYIPDKAVSFPKPNPDEIYSFDRVSGKYSHFRTQSNRIESGLINALASLKDENIKARCIDIVTNIHKGYVPILNFESCIANFLMNNYPLPNLVDIYYGLNKKQKSDFLRILFKKALYMFFQTIREKNNTATEKIHKEIKRGMKHLNASIRGITHLMWNL